MLSEGKLFAEVHSSTVVCEWIPERECQEVVQKTICSGVCQLAETVVSENLVRIAITNRSIACSLCLEKSFGCAAGSRSKIYAAQRA